MEIAPADAPPIINDGITLNGSPAAKGIAPSEMKESPKSYADFPFSRSVSVNTFLSIMVAKESAIGGAYLRP
ncbi:hypothetical protein FRC0182_01324 [Corynebacterium diphtheriae]|nr:hypothetical protein FRC0182_01324 [Corynebacterium diphtheriae]